jgi:hypothetical protein
MASGPHSTSHEQTLDRILTILEQSHRRTWMEVACAVILSLATTCSAWCAYQSKVWMGLQGRQLGTIGDNARQAEEKVLVANQIRSMEAAMFIKFFEAKQSGDDKLAEFFAGRLPEQTKVALEAWWKTKPLENAKAPAHPFVMAEYKQPLLDEATQLRSQSGRISKEATAAGHNSDSYVLLTVLFASVLFFGGIGNTFESRRLRKTMIFISIGLFLLTFAYLVSMPVHWEWPFGGND